MNNMEIAPSKAIKRNNRHQPYQRTSDETLQTYPNRQHDFSLTIDIAGRITDCTEDASTLLGQHAEELTGQMLSDAILKLPFSSNTPYYNFAYAVFHSGADKTLRRTILLADGREMPINVSLSPTVVRGRRLIKVRLTPSETDAAERQLT
jgi:PAS domain S-box-containing protein